MQCHTLARPPLFESICMILKDHPFHALGRERRLTSRPAEQENWAQYMEAAGSMYVEPPDTDEEDNDNEKS